MKLAGNLLKLVVLVAFIYGAVWVVREFNHREAIPVQTSPEGEWHIEITGHRLWSGSVQVVVSMSTPAGRTGRSVKGIEASFETFHKKYDELEFRGDTAYAGGQVFLTRPAGR